MTLRTIAGREVSKICLGTMTWGQQNTEAEAHEQISYALERGINMLDAAEMYPVPPRAETQVEPKSTSVRGSKRRDFEIAMYWPPRRQDRIRSFTICEVAQGLQKSSS